MSKFKKKHSLKHSSNAVRNIINLSLVFISLVVVIQFMTYMQKQYSFIKAKQTSEAALQVITESLDANTQKIASLRDRYHADNLALLEDISTLLKSENYVQRMNASNEQRSKMMERLSAAVGTTGHLFIINQAGTIIVAPEIQYDGENLVSNGTLTEEQLSSLTHKSENKQQLNQADVIAIPNGSNIEAYFYGCNLNDDYTLVYAVDTLVLDKQLTALCDIGPVLSSVVVSDHGFVFAIDSNTNRFMYYHREDELRDGQPITDAGLSRQVVRNNYNGLQIIDGVQYHCLSKAYSSPYYGEYTVITAVNAAESIFAGNKLAITATSIAFIVCALIMAIYSGLLRIDSDQLVLYDENLCSFLDLPKKRKSQQDRSINNVRIFSIKGTQFYYKAGIAQRLAPVLAISLLVIFVVSWNAQMLVEISKGMKQSSTAIKQLEVLFSTRETSSETLIDRYQEQYMAKLRVISFLTQEDPSFLNDTLDETIPNVHAYVDDNLQPILNGNGTPVRSIANCSRLQTIAHNNNFDFLAIYDDQGKTIAVNDDMWYFAINREKGSQSAAFLDIITGKSDVITQEPRVDENGRNMQYMGIFQYYYLLDGEGPDCGRFVSVNDYNEYKQNGSYVYNDCEYAVVRHRALLQGGISDETINGILESISNEALLQRVRVGKDGFTMLFDNTRDHVCVWSPNKAAIGRTAEELNISSGAFSGTYKGFVKINNDEHFQTIVFNNGYWIATLMPTESLLAGRDPIALITTLVAAAFYILLFVICIFSTQQEETVIVEGLEKRIKNRNDNGMVKVEMPSGRIKYVRSASARFSDTRISWEDKTTSQRFTDVLNAILSVIVLVLMIIILFCDSLFGAESVLSYIVHGNWEHSFNYFALVAFGLTILCVSVISFIVSRFISFAIRNMGSRIETVGRLLLSVVKYGAVLFAIFYGLSLLGISTAGLVTSASIMSIVIGLGAQSLIGDILSGIFIVFEGDFRVGDIVTVADFRGSVVDIGLRTTKIENMTGDIKIFNNSSIAGIINMTKKASKALCVIGIEYGQDLEKVEKLLHQTLPVLGKKNSKILNGPNYDGVVALNESSVTVQVSAACSEKDRISVSRYLNRELLLIFKRNNIRIPFPQVTVSYLDAETNETDEDYKEEI